jgi:pullulanase
MDIDLLKRRTTHFVLWRPRNTATPPRLIIGRFQPGNPPSLADDQQFPLTQTAGFPDLWEIAASACDLQDGLVYHYWFEVDDSDPGRSPPARIRCTDPAAGSVDWRLRAPALPAPYNDDDRHAASVVRFAQGQLVPCDPGGEVGSFAGDPGPAGLPPNNRMVIYELPTAWTQTHTAGGKEVGVGTFRDVTALVDRDAGGANFAHLDVTQPGRSYLAELGVNALELLPPADSFFKRTWGYDTANFFAPDAELGQPEGNSWPTANQDLAALVRACHRAGVRFLVDMVMAFARHGAYQNANFPEFHIDDPKGHPDDPDAKTSGRGYGGQAVRDGFGSVLFRYTASVAGAYDPVGGQAGPLVPARQLMKAQLARWMADFRIDGVRMDSVENVANWDFVGEFKDLARRLWKERWDAQGLGAGADERFLVVGEELSLPLGLLTQGRLDGLWNEAFKKLVRCAVRGRNADDEPSFEWTVRKAIDCRHLGFADGAQAVNYLTSHDVEGPGNERLYNYLLNCGIWDTKKRIQLAFACLLTAVGIPMILAGDEFADQHDRLDEHGWVTESGGKEVDPVNYSRLSDPWRREVFDYVARLVKFRTGCEALSVNDTAFIHADFNDGKRVLAWRRGRPDGDGPVVVVANFSDFGSDLSRPGAEYVVPNWPATPPGRQWKEVTQDRIVPPEWVGREPLYAWEAKVYTVV